MKGIKNVIFLSSLLFVGMIPQTILSKNMTIISPSGEKINFEIEKTDNFEDVVDRICSFFSDDEILQQIGLACEDCDKKTRDFSLNNAQFEMMVSHAGITVRAKEMTRRDYSIPAKKKEREDITYIITHLAYDNIVKVGTLTSSLKKAGKRIDDVHPFCFLIFVFNNEELKAGIHAIRDRGGWIWDGFIKGLTGSLAQEAERKNLYQFTKDFAQKVNIDLALITSTLEKEQWGEFVNTLINNIPRENNPDRYRKY